MVLIDSLNPAGDKTIPNLRELLDGSEIVIGDPSLIGPHWYNMPPSVKWIQSTWAGVDGIRRKYIDPSRVSARALSVSVSRC